MVHARLSRLSTSKRPLTTDYHRTHACTHVLRARMCARARAAKITRGPFVPWCFALRRPQFRGSEQPVLIRPRIMLQPLLQSSVHRPGGCYRRRLEGAGGGRVRENVRNRIAGNFTDHLARAECYSPKIRSLRLTPASGMRARPCRGGPPPSSSSSSARSWKERHRSQKQQVKVASPSGANALGNRARRALSRFPVRCLRSLPGCIIKPDRRIQPVRSCLALTRH